MIEISRNTLPVSQCNMKPKDALRWYEFSPMDNARSAVVSVSQMKTWVPPNFIYERQPFFTGVWQQFRQQNNLVSEKLITRIIKTRFTESMIFNVQSRFVQYFHFKNKIFLETSWYSKYDYGVILSI